MSQISTDWTVLRMLEWATDYFRDKKISNPRVSIEWLLSHVLEKKRLDLYLIFDRPLTLEELDAIRPMVQRRANHEPLQYITGETNFFGYTIKVQPGVLIPRPETEELVEWVLQKEPSEKELNVLDIGTGSGCIPIAIKKQRSDWNLYAFDISPEAIQISSQNAKLNAVEINFSINDVFSTENHLLSTRFDVIISNPPYILLEEADSLDNEVKKFEPDVALFTSSTEKIYQAIEQFASKTLKTTGLLALEINEKCGAKTLQLFDSDYWDAYIQKDYAGKERFLFAKRVK